jgi:hypothetical protein
MVCVRWRRVSRKKRQQKKWDGRNRLTPSTRFPRARREYAHGANHAARGVPLKLVRWGAISEQSHEVPRNGHTRADRRAVVPL